MRINWKMFEENSSTMEALHDFAEGETRTYTAWGKACWPKECKKEIKARMNSSLRIDQVRKRAKRFLRGRY